MTTISRPHTLASIAAETDASKRTVQRWLQKALAADPTNDIGMIEGDTRYFSDAERDVLTSYQSKKASKPEIQETRNTVIEGELVEPGVIQLHANTEAATGLINFDLPAIDIELPALDITALEANTTQLEASAQQGANAISAYFAARFDVGLAKIAAAQDNLLKGIQANALNGAAQSVSASQGKA